MANIEEGVLQSSEDGASTSSRKFPLRFASLVPESFRGDEEHAHNASFQYKYHPATRAAGDSLAAQSRSQKCNNRFSEYLLPDASVWTQYLSVARVFDGRFVEAFDKGLDALLVFSGLFSAVLSAFLIEVRKGLQPNPQDITNARLLDVLDAIKNNAGATASVSALSESFAAPVSVVTVTSLWFMSLVISLMASLGAILAKTWILDYGEWMTSNPGLPRDDTRAHHSRYAGAMKWRLATVISSIPILIHLALFLFFAGLVVLLWGDNQTVAIFTTVLVGTAALLYVAGTVLPIIYEGCPLSTPLTTPLRHLISIIRRARIRLYINYRYSNLLSPLKDFLRRWMDLDTLSWTGWQARYPHDERFGFTLLLVLSPIRLVTFVPLVLLLWTLVVVGFLAMSTWRVVCNRWVAVKDSFPKELADKELDTGALTWLLAAQRNSKDVTPVVLALAGLDDFRQVAPIRHGADAVLLVQEIVDHFHNSPSHSVLVDNNADVIEAHISVALQLMKTQHQFGPIRGMRDLPLASLMQKLITLGCSKQLTNPTFSRRCLVLAHHVASYVIDDVEEYFATALAMMLSRPPADRTDWPIPRVEGGVTVAQVDNLFDQIPTHPQLPEMLHATLDFLFNLLIRRGLIRVQSQDGQQQELGNSGAIRRLIAQLFGYFKDPEEFVLGSRSASFSSLFVVLVMHTTEQCFQPESSGLADTLDEQDELYKALIHVLPNASGIMSETPFFEIVGHDAIVRVFQERRVIDFLRHRGGMGGLVWLIRAERRHGIDEKARYRDTTLPLRTIISTLSDSTAEADNAFLRIMLTARRQLVLSRVSQAVLARGRLRMGTIEALGWATLAAKLAQSSNTLPCLVQSGLVPSLRRYSDVHNRPQAIENAVLELEDIIGGGIDRRPWRGTAKHRRRMSASIISAVFSPMETRELTSPGHIVSMDSPQLTEPTPESTQDDMVLHNITPDTT